MDINEPGVAQRLYTLIREGKIVFKSVVGDDYLLYLSDMLADDYRAMSRNPFSKKLKYKLQRVSPGQVVGAVCMAGGLLPSVFGKRVPGSAKDQATGAPQERAGDFRSF